MFDHVTIRVSDLAASERFYDTVLRALGIEKTTPTTREHAAYLLDPDGNKVEVVNHNRL